MTGICLVIFNQHAQTKIVFFVSLAVFLRFFVIFTLPKWNYNRLRLQLFGESFGVKKKKAYMRSINHIRSTGARKCRFILFILTS